MQNGPPYLLLDVRVERVRFSLSHTAVAFFAPHLFRWAVRATMQPMLAVAICALPPLSIEPTARVLSEGFF